MHLYALLMICHQEAEHNIVRMMLIANLDNHLSATLNIVLFILNYFVIFVLFVFINTLQHYIKFIKDIFAVFNYWTIKKCTL